MGTRLHSVKTYLDYAWPAFSKKRLAIFVTALTAVFALIAAPIVTAQSSETTTRPVVLASVGDSISSRPFAAESWTTGTRPSINSIHLRLEAASGEPVTAVRKAQSGADSSKMVAQMQAAINADADLVTVLMGANDVCGPTLASMTPTATFASRYTEALRLADEAGVKTVAVSLPDIYGLWEVGKESVRARTIWNFYNVCQNLLENPRSTTPADTARRAAVRAQTDAYNDAIAAACAQFTSCAYDNGAVRALTPTIDDLATDYFHPDASGQAKIAAAVWPAVVELYPDLPAGEPSPTPTPTPEPTPPADTVTSKKITFTLPVKINIGISKVQLSRNGKTVTMNVKYLGNGKYEAAVDKSRLASGSSDVRIKAWNKNGMLIYLGTVPMYQR